MRTKKKMWIIAYDIADNKRRRRVVKVLEKYGTRANFSVFECMLTSSQLTLIRNKLKKVIDPSDDKVIFYPICLNCYAKVEYMPDKKIQMSIVRLI